MSQSHLVLDREGAPHIESVQDIKPCVRAANFTGATEQHTLLTYMTMKSRLQGFALRLAARSIRDDAHVASDSLGCCMSLISWAWAQPVGLLHRLRRRFRAVHPGLRRKDFVHLRCPFHVSRAARQPGSTERARVSMSGRWQTTTSPSGFTAPTRASGFRTSGPCWPIARHRRAPRMALMETQNGRASAYCQNSLRIYRRNQYAHHPRRPGAYHPDHQQPCEPWLFVLREDAVNYVVPEPRELGLNGSFAVFKKVETDVVGL